MRIACLLWDGGGPAPLFMLRAEHKRKSGMSQRPPDEEKNMHTKTKRQKRKDAKLIHNRNEFFETFACVRARPPARTRSPPAGPTDWQALWRSCAVMLDGLFVNGPLLHYAYEVLEKCMPAGESVIAAVLQVCFFDRSVERVFWRGMNLQTSSETGEH